MPSPVFDSGEAPGSLYGYSRSVEHSTYLLKDGLNVASSNLSALTRRIYIDLKFPSILIE